MNSLYRARPLARHTLSLSTLETGVGGHKLKANLDYIHSKSLSQKQRAHAVLCEMHAVTPPLLFLFLGFGNLIEKALNSLVNSV